jgi:Ca2+-transporting ATPase
LALLWDEVWSVPVLLQVASATVSFLAGGLIDGLVIRAVVVTNTAIGFLTEEHAERTIATLTATAAPNALVLRSGRVLKVDAALITVGDIVPLSPGAYIPADGRLLEARQLTVAEPALTGESAHVAKVLKILPTATPWPIGATRCIAALWLRVVAELPS